MSNLARKKRSKIWLIPKNILEEVSHNSTSLNEILLKLKLDNKSASYKTLKAKIVFENIDISHIRLGLGANKDRKHYVFKKQPLSEILVENSSYNRQYLKKRLFNEGILKNQCYICDQLPEWNGKPLTLQLDHINGISDDNRVENLRILCPHCHSQTETFGGKRFKKEKSTVNSDPLWRSKPRVNGRKIERPSKEELEKILWEKPATHIAKYFGVTSQAIHKWAKNYGILKPPPGYWIKINKK